MIEKNLYDKTDWEPGPWQEESDYLVWIDETSNYHCHMRRNEQGAWCGFVGLPRTHPLFLYDNQSVVWDSFNVHGGIGFTGYISKEDVLFTPPEKVWWVGFNCAQSEDLTPRKRPPNEIFAKRTTKKKRYRTVDYVRKQVAKLAAQLKEVEGFDDQQ